MVTSNPCISFYTEQVSQERTYKNLKSARRRRKKRKSEGKEIKMCWNGNWAALSFAQNNNEVSKQEKKIRNSELLEKFPSVHAVYLGIRFGTKKKKFPLKIRTRITSAEVACRRLKRIIIFFFYSAWHDRYLSSQFNVDGWTERLSTVENHDSIEWFAERFCGIFKHKLFIDAASSHLSWIKWQNNLHSARTWEPPKNTWCKNSHEKAYKHF